MRFHLPADERHKDLASHLPWSSLCAQDSNPTWWQQRYWSKPFVVLQAFSLYSVPRISMSISSWDLQLSEAYAGEPLQLRPQHHYSPWDRVHCSSNHFLEWETLRNPQRLCSFQTKKLREDSDYGYHFSSLVISSLIDPQCDMRHCWLPLVWRLVDSRIDRNYEWFSADA
jgi:hypothetical protein